MNRPLDDVLIDLIAETGKGPVLNATNRRLAASPHIKTEGDQWVWRCEVWVPAEVQGGGRRFIGEGSSPTEAASDCYRRGLGADRSDWNTPS